MVGLKYIRISRQRFADPVNNGFGGNGCVEAVSQSNRVGSGYATRASACDKQVVFIDEAGEFCVYNIQSSARKGR